MKIKSFRFIKKSLPLKNTIYLDSKEINAREITLIRLETEDNIAGVGEAVILQSHGTESQETLNTRLEYLSHNIFNYFIEDNFLNNKHLLDNFNNTPALRTALEQVIFNILLKNHKSQIYNILNLNVKETIKLNALIPFLPEDQSFILIKQKIIEGFKNFKIKLGYQSIEEDINFIGNISNSFPEIKFRLDPNCKWTKEEIIKNLTSLERLNIDYIEQPCLSSADLIDIQTHTHIKIAADESAKDLISIKRLIDEGIKVIILKPLTTGGIINSLEVINYANKKNTDVIITSSFESNVGLQIPILLAATLNSENYHGLNTASFFKRNLNYKWPIKNDILNASNIKNPIKDFYD